MSIAGLRFSTVVALLVPLAMLATVTAKADDPARRRSASLAGVVSWHYQLQNVRVGELAASAADLLVVDLEKSEGVALGPDQLERLKTKPDGSRRIVLAYFSIGEAEDYRDYWRAEWRKTPPSWLVAENCRWRGNHIVRFWDAAWHDIVYAGEDSYLERIQDAGFDGVYLDRVDVWESLKDERADARAQMTQLVRRLAARARERDPEFLVVAQNGEELLQSREYRGIIDGIAKEDLLFGLEGDGRRNDVDEIDEAARHLMLLRRDGKPVLTVEYLPDPETMLAAQQEHRRLGFIPTFAARDLDTLGPLAPRSAGEHSDRAETPLLQRMQQDIALSGHVPCRSQ